MFANFTLSAVNKVTTRTYSFVSVILKVAHVPSLDNIHFSPHVNSSSILKFIKGISNDLQKLLRYFNGTAIFTFFIVPSAATLPIRSDLYLKKNYLHLR